MPAAARRRSSACLRHPAPSETLWQWPAASRCLPAAMALVAAAAAAAAGEGPGAALRWGRCCLRWAFQTRLSIKRRQQQQQQEAPARTALQQRGVPREGGQQGWQGWLERRRTILRVPTWRPTRRPQRWRAPLWRSTCRRTRCGPRYTSCTGTAMTCTAWRQVRSGWMCGIYGWGRLVWVWEQLCCRRSRPHLNFVLTLPLCLPADPLGQFVASACRAQSADTATIWLWDTARWTGAAQLAAHTLTGRVWGQLIWKSGALAADTLGTCLSALPAK